MFLLIILFLQVAQASLFRGKPLVFNSTSRGRSLKSNSDLYYVKSDTPPSNLAAREVLGSGVYLVRGPPGEDLPFGLWTPDMKFDPREFNSSSNFQAVVRTDFSDSYLPPRGCRSMRPRFNRVFVVCQGVELLTIAQDDRVLWIAPAPPIRKFAYESRLLMQGASALNGSGIVVSVSDSGLDEYHCAFYEGSLAPRCSINLNRQKTVGLCKAASADFEFLANAHGSAAAGVAVGKVCAWETGVAPAAKLAFIDIGKGYTSSGSEALAGFSAYELLGLIADTGASVHSASWGFDNADARYMDFDSVYDQDSYDDKTKLHVRSGGNEGPWGKTGNNAKSGLVVGACLSRAQAYTSMSSVQRNNNPTLYSHTSQAWFSSTGPTKDGRLLPQVCAPGLYVQAPRAVKPNFADHTDYVSWSGTSFSAPAIAGLAANLQQRKLDATGFLPTAALIEAQLMAHAQKPVRVVQTSGNQLIEVSAPEIQTLGTPIMDFERMTDVDGLSVSGTGRVAICLENLDTEAWNVVLRWTDPAVNYWVTPTLVNDLDMVMVSVGGTVHIAEDERNSFEVVNAWAPSHTRLIVSVFGGVSTQGAQPFAVHAKAKSARVDCSSTTLPYEYAACTNGINVPTTWKGDTVCEKTLCLGTSCGYRCGRVCAGSACDIAGGEGRLDANGVCRPTSCSGEGLFVGETSCACKPLLGAKLCSSGRAVMCTAEGVFPSCPAPSSELQAATSSAERASGIRFLLLLALLAFL
jgi:subtilisin family serine protease